MIDIAKIQELAETIEIDETVEGMSAYGVWKVAKEVFETLGLEFLTKDGKSVPSQAFYNYAKNGTINGVKDSKQKFSDEEVEQFVAKLVAKANR
jgi:hypothetical protein